MATFTDYYNLKKPEDTDFFDIADMNGNSDIIDATLSDFAKQLSDSASKDIIDCIDKGVMAHRLGVFGQKSGIYKNPTFLENLAYDDNALNDAYCVNFILDGLIDSEIHMGNFFKKVTGSGDTSFDSLSDIESVISSDTAFGIIMNNEKSKKLIYASEKAFKILAENSSAISTVLADEGFFKYFKNDSRIRDVVYSSNVMAESMGENTEFLNFMFSVNEENYVEIISNSEFLEKLFKKQQFNQRLLLNINIIKYILNNAIATKILCENENACNTILGNESIISLFKENIGLLAPVLQYEYSTAVFKDNDEIMVLISKNPNCLYNLALSGGEIDFDFYKNIQKYRANIQNTIFTTRTIKILEYGSAETVGKKGKGIIYMFKGGESTLRSNINFYADIEKTKLLKTITSSNYDDNMLDIVCFGTFFMEHLGAATRITRNILVLI